MKIDVKKLEELIASSVDEVGGIWLSEQTLIGKKGKIQIQLIVTRDEGDTIEGSKEHICVRGL